ncbi:MAG: cellulose synthase subunit BcsC-related outer membrane protein, partial [Methylohalobius sp.]
EALWRLSPERFATLLEEAKPKLSPTAYAEISYQNLRRRLLAASQDPGWAPPELEPDLLAKASARRDLSLITALAWAWYRAGSFHQARAWFEAGLALAPKDRKLGQGLLSSLIGLKEDEAIVNLGQRYPYLRQDAGSYLLGRAWEYYRKSDYPTSQKLAEQAGRWLAQAEGAQYLQGWLALKRRQYEEAQRIFAALFKAHPNRPDYARALVTSHLQAGEDPERLGERFPQAELLAALSPHIAQRAFARKQFLRAYRFDPQAFAEFKRLTAPTLGLGGMTRFRSGQAGLDRLQIAIAPWYEGSYPLTTQQFALSLGRVELHSDRLKPAGIRALQASKEALSPSQQAALAKEAVALREAPWHTAEAAWLELAYRQEGRLNPYFQVGLTPIGAELSPRPTARLGISDWLDGAAWQWRWQAEAYRQPIRQSLLSYTGWEFFGKRWGRVLRNGARFSGLGLIGPLALYQAIEGAFIDGQSTQDNWMVGYTLAAGYNLPWPKFFDYLSFGPYFHFMHYANNQNHFRPGHGGYFSPQAFYAGGVQLAFRTEEGRRFLLESRVALGIQHFREEAASWFPRGCTSSPLCDLKFPKNRETSFAPSGELRFAFQLHPHLQLIGGVYARQTLGWREAGGGLLVRVLFAPGASVLSADLPEALFAAIE